MSFPSEITKALIQLALEEDLPSGDITANLTVDSQKVSTADLIANQDLCLCGSFLPQLIFNALSEKVEIKFNFKDGDFLTSGSIIGHLYGNTRAILKAERTILNFLQKLSGISTYTFKAVKDSCGITLLDTRKTTPGWRELEKYAVRTAGARNHRMNLSDMVLVKDNHINSNNFDIELTVQKALKKPSDTKIEVEVRNLTELRKALPYNLDFIMLDNFSLAEITEALEIVRQSNSTSTIEISGGIKPEDLPRLKNAGVTLISTSSFITKSNWVDISLDLKTN
jgi:nicotinate-nucleotide pyrophosphorylase (carboxylating)